jgi:hypothetical protein
VISRGVIALALSLIAASPAAASDDEAIRLAATQLLGAQLPSGLLTYDFDFVTRAPVSKDSIARQAAGVAFFGEYYEETKDARARRALEAGLAALERLSVPFAKGWLPSLIEASGLLSLPFGRQHILAALDRLGLLYQQHGEGRLPTFGGDYGAAVSGATALALIAELRYSRATHDDRFQDARAAWLKGLVALHRPGRGFRTSPARVEESPFFNGEAWVALALYHRLVPADVSVRELLTQLDHYFMTRYDNDVESGFYHWGAIAAAERFDVTADPRFLDFLGTQATKIDAVLAATPFENSCAAIEGLATAAGVLARQPGYEAIATKIAARVDLEMAQNRRLQIPPKTERVPVGRDVYLVSPDFPRFAGAFLASGSRVYTRIDITGHCLSAMLMIRRFGGRLVRSQLSCIR